MWWPVAASTAMVRRVGRILVGQHSVYPVILNYQDDGSWKELSPTWPSVMDILILLLGHCCLLLSMRTFPLKAS